MTAPKKKSAWGPLEVTVLAVIIGFFAWAWIETPFIKHPYTTPAYSCINNLRQIEAAKNEWAIENRQTNNVSVTESDITPYINGRFPKCPSGGTYTIGKLDELPTCSLGTNVNPPHVLP